MSIFKLNSRMRHLVAFGTVLTAASVALAQGGATGARTGGGGGGGGGGFGGASGGGGGGGGTSNNGTRQYSNTTLLGDAMITSDQDTRSLIVVTDDDTFEIIKGIVAKLDQPKPQVLIDCVFVQVSLTDELDLGAETSYTGPDGLGLKNGLGVAQSQFGLAGLLNNASGTNPATVGTTPTVGSPSNNGAFYTLTSKNVDATIHALAATNKTEVLSRPSVLTRSNQQATILVGQEVPLINGFTPLTVGSSTTLTPNVVQQNIGIILKVTPFITQDGNVEMILDPEISSLSSETVSLGNGANSPIINIISADTVVVTPNNQTIVIGGLISTQNTEVQNKVPLLGDIPLLGYAFKYSTKNKQKTELLVFLTPHIVRDPSELSNLSVKEASKADSTAKDFNQKELKKYDAVPSTQPQ